MAKRASSTPAARPPPPPRSPRQPRSSAASARPSSRPPRTARAARAAALFGGGGPRGCAVDYGADDLPPARGTPAYRWLKSSRWHAVEAADAYASDGDGDGDDTPRAKIDARRQVRHPRRQLRRMLHRRAAGPGTGSWSSGEDSGWFSSDGDGDGPFGRF